MANNIKHVMPQKRMKPEDWQRMQDLYDSGKNDREIAEQIGCSMSTVQNFRLHRGLPCQRDVVLRERRMNGLDRARIAMLELGMNSYYDYMAYKAKQEAGA